MVAYENLLRDGGYFTTPAITSNGIGVNNWPPVFGNASIVGKQVDNKQVIQLLNFNGVSTFEWRDNSKSQTKPNVASNFSLTLDARAAVSKVWFASPDFNGGASQELEFQNSEGQVTFTVPYLEYWSMIVIEN